PAGSRSSSLTSGTSSWSARTNADLFQERQSSPKPVFQWRAARRQRPGNAASDAASQSENDVLVYPSRFSASTAFGPASISPPRRRGKWTPRNGTAGSGTG